MGVTLPHRNAAYWLANRVGGWLCRTVDGVQELVARAERETGLCDWGEYDFRAPLEVLLDAYSAVATLNGLGRMAIRYDCLRLLSNRLRLQDAVARYPEIREVAIERPVVLTGLPRTGSTFLHRLLARDPGTRSLQLWELFDPTPPPEAASYDTDPRRRTRIPGVNDPLAALVMSREFVDRARAIHPLAIDEPDECIYLLANSFFCVSYFDVFADATAYFDWARQTDAAKAYRDLRSQLQVLTWRHAGQRLILKAPAHLENLDALMRVFPDAKVVWLHRDPAAVIPSACSLLAHGRSMANDRVDLDAIGRYRLEAFAENVRRGMEARRALPSEAFLDMDYERVRKDPLAAARDLYAFLGDELSSEAEAAMRAYASANRQHKHGIRRYALDDFGLELGQIREQFHFYQTWSQPCQCAAM